MRHHDLAAEAEADRTGLDSEYGHAEIYRMFRGELKPKRFNVLLPDGNHDSDAAFKAAFPAYGKMLCDLFDQG